VLRAPGDLGGNVDLLELVAQHRGGLLDVLLAVGAALADHPADLLELARVQRLEREVLELPLQLVDAEPVRERRVDLERLLRLLHLLLLAEVLDRAHVVEAVGELDQDHPHVLGHRHDHLPVVLGLGLLAALELDPRQLGDALDQVGDLVAELAAHLLDVGVGVLDDVVEQRGGDRLLVEMEARADLRHAPGVMDEVLAGAALLALVRVLRVRERPCEELAVDVRRVRGDVRQQLVDEVLVLPGCLHESHVISVVPYSGATFSRGLDAWPMNLSVPCVGFDAESRSPSWPGCSSRWRLSPPSGGRRCSAART